MTRLERGLFVAFPLFVVLMWADLLEVSDLRDWMPDISEHRLREYDRAAIELLRARFEQMIAERSKRDA